MKKVIIGFAIALILVLAYWFGFSNKTNPALLTQSFNSYVFKTQSAQKLVIFELRATEHIVQKEKLGFLWQLFSFKDVTTEMYVPVEYNFFVDVKEFFKLDWEGKKLIVHAPALQMMTPAVNVSGITFQAKGAPFFYDSKKVEQQFKDQMTEYLKSQSNYWMQSYMNEANKSLKKLVHDWLIMSKIMPDIKEENLEVIFANQEQVLGKAKP